MKPLFLLFLVFQSAFSEAACIILLHGLARTENSMTDMQDALTEQGYKVVNLGYPSRHYPIEILASKAINRALASCGSNIEIHFVTHSMGGILVRQYLDQNEIPLLNHVVMMAPPNKGSEVVDALGGFLGYKLLNGDAGLQLGTDENSIPNTLGSADFDLGIIAGTNSINFILSSIIPGEDDGKVSVKRTRLVGMNDHITMPVTHTFMMNNKQVISQVIHYLKEGEFKHGDE
ncbi:MAG: hypothetical protein JKY88_18615 [Pseudomonadales bacterium]|nr:hypothetical protein [Pseudomonadales bacterium]